VRTPPIPERFDAPMHKDHDPVKRPSHYRMGEIEAIDIIEQITSGYPPELAYKIGSALKYIIRAPYKGKMSEDLSKGEWFLRRAVNRSINLKQAPHGHDLTREIAVP
jgi:hypothetical protein